MEGKQLQQTPIPGEDYTHAYMVNDFELFLKKNQDKQWDIRAQDTNFAKSYKLNLTDEEVKEKTQDIFPNSDIMGEQLIAQLDSDKSSDTRNHIELEENDSGLLLKFYTYFIAIGGYKKDFVFKFPMAFENLEPTDILQRQFQKIKTQQQQNTLEQQNQYNEVKSGLTELKDEVNSLNDQIKKDGKKFFESQFGEFSVGQNIINQEVLQKISSFEKVIDNLKRQIIDSEQSTWISPIFNAKTKQAAKYGSFSKKNRLVNSQQTSGYVPVFAQQPLPKDRTVKFSVQLVNGSSMAIGIVSGEYLGSDSCYGNSYSHYGGQVSMNGLTGQSQISVASGQIISFTINQSTRLFRSEINGKEGYSGFLPDTVTKAMDLYPFVELWEANLRVKFL